MTKILEVTYSNGNLVLSESLDPALEGKRLRILVMEPQETVENLNPEQQIEQVKDFLAWSKRISFQLPPDYKFNRDELHER
jgi:predicted DNA-binding antitoxin AbrB/MazE fold protein